MGNVHGLVNTHTCTQTDGSIDATKYYFSNRVVNVWNSLPNYIVSAPSVSSFKRHLQQFELSM